MLSTLPTSQLPKNVERQWLLSDTKEAWEEAKRNGLTKYEDHSVIYLLNSHGYRGGNFVDPGSKVFKVVAIGDETTFGLGLPEQDTWCFQLCREIASRYKMYVRHYNFALPVGLGDTVTHCSTVVDSLLEDKFKPDLTVIMFRDVIKCPNLLKLPGAVLVDTLQEYHLAQTAKCIGIPPQLKEMNAERTRDGKRHGKWNHWAWAAQMAKHPTTLQAIVNSSVYTNGWKRI